MADTSRDQHDIRHLQATEKVPYSPLNLRRIRKQRKFSQIQLAKVSGVCRVTIQMCEGRKDANPTYQVLLALGKALNVIWGIDWQSRDSLQDEVEYR